VRERVSERERDEGREVEREGERDRDEGREREREKEGERGSSAYSYRRAYYTIGT
jgi:hypothetical protein